MSDTTTPARDYLAEAHAIIKNEDKTLPFLRREHLVALQDASDRAALIGMLLNRVLIGIMVDAKQPSVLCPAGMVTFIEEQGFDLTVQRAKTGQIICELIRPHTGPVM